MLYVYNTCSEDKSVAHAVILTSFFFLLNIGLDYDCHVDSTICFENVQYRMKYIYTRLS